MELEMARELKNFLASLKPVWEDVHEFDWLHPRDLVLKEKKTDLSELNRFPGLKIILETKQQTL
tara:strand:- start:532 stop:723 length:192 start_codon:yes stop_codon:yes gene_type:complete